MRPLFLYLGVLDGHDDTGGQDELLPRLPDVEDVDPILLVLKPAAHKKDHVSSQVWKCSQSALACRLMRK